jgi:hypothetical protein
MHWNEGSRTSGRRFGCMGSSNPGEQILLTFFSNAIPMLAASGVDVMTSLGKAFTAAPQYR